MKQNIKRVLLVLCMVACFFSLSACSKASAEEAETIDESTAAYIVQVSEGLLEQFVELSEADATEIEANLIKAKETGLASGVTSWLSVMKDTGEFVDVISSEARLEEDETYSCTVQGQFANRKCEFKIFYEMVDQSLNPTSVSFSPEYTVGENMAKAGMNTIMGMGTVFLVLIFISLLISCFKYIRVFENKMKEKKAASAPAPAPAPAPAVVEEEEELADDLELVAVITAAIAAATNSSSDGLVVRSIKRAPGAKWKRA